MIKNFDDLDLQIKETQVVILAGGSGKRMGKIDVPKALLKLNGKTLLDIELEYYAKWGFKKFSLLLGFGHEKILEHLEKIKDFIDSYELEIKISIDPTTKNWGKGKALKYALQKGVIDKTKRAIISYPDDLKLDKSLPIKLLLQHLYGVEKFNILATLAVVSAVEFPFGVAKINGEGKIYEFVEKPMMNVFTSIGVAIFEPKVFDLIEEMIDLNQNKSIEFESIVFPKLAKDSKLYSLILPTGSWIAVNDIKSYEKALKIFKESL